MILPSLVYTEKALLSSLVIDNKSIYDVANEVTPDWFSSSANKYIYEAILSCRKASKSVDYIKLISEIKKRGMEEVVTNDYILSIGDVDSSPYNIKTYVSDLREVYLKRKLLQEINEFAQDIMPFELDDIANRLSDSLTDLMQNTNGGEVRSAKDIFLETMSFVEDKMKNPEKYKGLKTGFYDLDKILGGLVDTEYIILAARPSLGKTTLALNIVRNCAEELRERKKNCLFFSLEMSDRQLINRISSNISRVDLDKFRDGVFVQQDFMSLTTHSEEIMDLPLRVYEKSGVTVQEIFKVVMKEKNVGLIIIDYLQLLSGSGKHNTRNDEVTKISAKLQALAKAKRVPLIVLSQLNRELEKQKRKPRNSDLRDSGSIEQDADIVVFIHGDQNEDKNAVIVDREIIVTKNRNGRIGEADLQFHKDYNRFENKAKDYLTHDVGF